MRRMKKWVLPLALLAAVLLCYAPWAQASNLTATVHTGGKEVTVTGATAPDTFVTILVTRVTRAIDGDIRYADQARSGQNGSYSFAFEMSEGDYKVTVVSNGIYRQEAFSIRDARAATVALRVEGAENTLFPRKEVNILDGETTLLKAIQDALDQNGVAYEMAMAGDMIGSIAGESGWQWLVNNQGGMALPSTPLHGGDEIVLVDNEIWEPVITQLSVSNDRVKVGEEFTVTLQKVEGASRSAAANQPVTFDGEAKTTDAEGKATFTARKDGTFEVTSGPAGSLIRPIPVLIAVSKTEETGNKTTVTISPPTKTVNVGETFSLDVVITPAVPIAGAQFNLSFNPAVVEVTSVAEGNLLKQGGAGTYFQAGTVDNTNGKLTGVAGSITTPGAEVSGTGTFAAITFKAKAQGTRDLTLSNVVVGNKAGQAVAVTVTGGSVTVTAAPPAGGGVGAPTVTTPAPQVKADDIEKAKAQEQNTLVHTTFEKAIIAAEALTKAAELKMDLVVKKEDGKVAVTIPPGAITVAGGAVVEINLKQLTQGQAAGITVAAGMPEGMKIITPVYDLTVLSREGAGQAGVVFNKAITLTFSYAGAAVTSEDNLAVYCYNEKTARWDKVGGQADKKAKQITCSVSHLSKYTVMETTQEAKVFSDLPAGHWAKEVIEFMAAKDFLKGYPDGACRPDNPVTRAEFAAFLGRVLGLQEAEGEVAFTDVKPDNWHYRVIAAAFRHGLVKGYSDGRFAPDDPVTREQVAAMITRALAAKGISAELNEAQTAELLGRFKDSSEISIWAGMSVAAAANQGLVSGYPDQTFKPQNTATRAECAAMLKRLYEK